MGFFGRRGHGKIALRSRCRSHLSRTQLRQRGLGSLLPSSPSLALLGKQELRGSLGRAGYVSVVLSTPAQVVLLCLPIWCVCVSDAKWVLFYFLAAMRSHLNPAPAPVRGTGSVCPSGCCHRSLPEKIPWGRDLLFEHPHLLFILI